MSSSTPAGPAPGTWRSEITKTQWLVLLGTTMGWALDGFAGSLYALVLGPAMTELLPNSGIAVNGASIGLYGGLTVALFLFGWGTGGILFGILADYFGRVRVLSVGIATYAIFTALAAFAETWWQLGVLRFIAGLGSGVEAPVGAALDRRGLAQPVPGPRVRRDDVGLRHGLLPRRAGLRPAGRQRLAADDGHRRGARPAGVVHPPPRPGARGDHRDHRRPPHPPRAGPGRRRRTASSCAGCSARRCCTARWSGPRSRRVR